MEQAIDSDLLWAVENMSGTVQTEWLECGYSWKLFYWKVIEENWWLLNWSLEQQTSKKDNT